MGRRSKLGFVTFLTLVRFPLVLLFLTCALVHTAYPAHSWLFVAALVSLVASSLTDVLDGYFARRLNVVTEFGGLADPLVDKFFYLATLPFLVFATVKNGHLGHGLLLLIMTVLFLLRDQWVTFLRAMGARHNVEGKALWAGKLRTSINFPVICAIYYFEQSPIPFIPARLLHVLEGLALVVNLLSVVVYTKKYWPCLKRAASPSIEEGVSPVEVASHDNRELHDAKQACLDVMASAVAHDFNNLLAAILGNAGIVLRRLPPESPARASAQQIELTTLRALELTNMMTVFCGKQSLDSARTDLSELVESMEDQLRATVSTHVAMVFDLSSRLPPVNADKNMLREMVQSLVTNASDFIWDEEGEIRVSTHVRDFTDDELAVACCGADPLVEGRYVTLTVSDTGCGITREIQPRIFDPFFTTKIRGQGMGLPVVLGIVRAHGGALTLRSKPEEGTTVSVLLPMAG